MNKFYILLIISLSILPTKLFSQVNIKGEILNKNKKPIEFIEIQLQNKDSIIINSELTNIDGKFNIIAERGQYKLSVVQLDKILYKQNIDLTQDVNLGEIVVTENQQQLIEVVVSAKKKLIERKVDRIIFNVENSISATGGDAIDALRVTPNVRVHNDQITMIGKSGMAVMVDDKMIQLTGDDLINYLKSISSDNIKSIEVITTPPAKYSAEGNSGIINITLKKAKPNAWSATTRINLKQATYFSSTLGGNFSYQKNKLSLLIDVTETKGKSIYENVITYKYPTQLWENNVYKKTKTDIYSTILNTDYKLTDNLKLGIQYSGNFYKPFENDNSKTYIYNNTDNLDQSLLKNGNTDSKTNNHSLNFNLSNKIDTTGKMFTIDIDYFTNEANRKNSFSNVNIDNITSQNTSDFINNNSNVKIDNYSLRIDFTMPYNWANVEYGGKIIATNSDNNVSAQFYDTTNGSNNLYLNQSSIFNYKEKTQAIYIASNKKFASKWEAKIGLRLETTQTIGFSETVNQKNKNNYTKLFPTSYLSFAANDNNNISLSVSRRINRPSYFELNPARWYQNLLSYAVGNPFLQPYFSTNAELSHVFKNRFTTTLSFSNNKNQSAQLTLFETQNNTQTQIIRRENYYNTQAISLQENITYPMTKWWNTVTSASILYSETDVNYTYLLPKYSGWMADFSSNNSFILNENKTFLAECTFSYAFPSKIRENYLSSKANLGISVKKIFLEKRLHVTLNANNILKTDRQIIKKTIQGINQSFNQYYDSQYIRLSATYKFGSSTINVNQKKGGNQDEKQRAL